ncbi:hypothetical protein AB834_02065 [PVC group bacterium (ex Bugula neritina AB1)]|nr:hypothetical protein AB834_02065 [PVC group bacterium (ex Bugula neritina AB1)]
MKVKICGITNFKDALEALDAGADYLGFIFYPKSSRYVSEESVSTILKKLPRKDFISVGVFVNADYNQIQAIQRNTGISMVQLHGEETLELAEKLGKEKVIKALRTRDIEEMKKWRDHPFVLLDGDAGDHYGGQGIRVNNQLVRQFKNLYNGSLMFVAGGLNPQNVDEAIEAFSPDGVDVSSGIELSPGIKNFDKMKAFIHKAKQGD